VGVNYPPLPFPPPPPPERDKNDYKWIDMTNNEVNKALGFNVHATQCGFFHRFLRIYTQSYSNYNFKYTTAESKVTLGICQTTGPIILIRTSFAIGTAICRTTNLYKFSEIVEYFSKTFIWRGYSPRMTMSAVNYSIHKKPPSAPYSERHESSQSHHTPFTSNLNKLVPSQAFPLRHDFQQTAYISHLSYVCHTPNQPILIRSITLM